MVLGFVSGIFVGAAGATLLLCFFIGAGKNERQMDRHAWLHQKDGLEEAA